MKDIVNLRIDLISDCRQMAIIFMKNFPNLDNSQMFKFICNVVINNLHLTQHEKNYLIFDLIITRDSQNIIEEIGERRLCKYCNSKVLAVIYCENCVRNYLKSRFNKWTTGNDKIDKLIQECQINSVAPSNIIEWIPFENFENIKPKTECGTSLVYTATWENGPYIEWDTEQQILKRGGKGTYILKRLNNSNKVEERWLKEVIENISIEKYSQSLIRCYGFTKDPTTRNYMLVLQHMDSNLRDYLTKKPDLPWKIIFKIVRNISNGIRKLHKLSNSAHKNLHPRNILVDEAKFHCVISDFWFDTPRNSSNSIYKNILYTAPEVLCNKPYTKKSDIYSLGMLMWELTSGKPPFNDEITKSVDEFASDIINGLRPKVVDGTPLDYTALMVKCWDAIPENRPDANIVMKEMESLLRNIYENDDINRELKPIPLNIDTKMPVKNLIKCLVRKFNRLGCLCKK